jgi:hydroxyethylthiazole kinase-like uncharacterized protein yjeF
MSRPIYTVAQIREIEKRAFARMPSFALMERAGAVAAAEAIKMRGDDARPVLFLAGPGNNGGDAFVAAAILAKRGIAVKVAFAASGDQKKPPPDAARALDEFIAAGGAISDKEKEKKYPDGDYALIVDGLFGIGLMREIGGVFADWIARANAASAATLAIDAPSGVNADSGACGKTAIIAARTVTFFGLKPGLCTGAGGVAAGDIVVAGLDEDDSFSLPPPNASFAGEAVGALIAGMENPSRLARRRDAHKGDFGAVALIGGASGMVGALSLAARAAVALGAGKVFAVALAGDAPAFDPLCPQAMWRRDLPPAFDCACAGVGMGQSENAAKLLDTILKIKKPLALDADALNLIAADSQLQKALADRESETTIITPHPAEAARLLKTNTAAIQADRLGAARELAKKYKTTAILKGAGAIIADAPADAGCWAINDSGNPGLAQGGAGDVLSGFIAALLAQTNNASFAARAATWLHGKAADILAAESGEIGINLNALAPAAAKMLNRQIQKNAALAKKYGG